jgi:hypothetical protein
LVDTTALQELEENDVELIPLLKTPLSAVAQDFGGDLTPYNKVGGTDQTL